MLVTVIVILAGVVVVASGRGGEMAPEYPDYPPIDLGPVSAADVALLRPPSAAWGYNMRVTDEALQTIARAVTERDIKISALQQEVSDLREELAHDWTRQSGAPGATVGAPGAAAEAERPEEGLRSTEPVRPLDEENAATGARWPGPPWAQPEPTQPQAAGTEPAGPQAAGPEPAGPQAAGPEPAGPQAAGPEPTAPRPVVSGAARHEPAPPQEPSGNESSGEEPSHGPPSYGVPGHAAAPYPAWDEANGQDSWEEPHQTLVWGAEHQRAKASRLQEQRQAPQSHDAPSENAPDDYRPTEDPPTGDPPSEGAPTEDWPGPDAPHQDTPTADAVTEDWPDEHALHQHIPGAPASGPDGPTEDARGQDSPGPASAGHWAQVTAPSHYEDARHPAQAEQDRE
jgi:hypothetical protein